MAPITSVLIISLALSIFAIVSVTRAQDGASCCEPDVAIILDRSYMGPKKYRAYARPLLANFTRLIPDCADLRAAVVEYATDAQVSFDFATYGPKSTLIDAMNAFTTTPNDLGFDSNLALGLRAVRVELLGESTSGHRSESPTTVVLITGTDPVNRTTATRQANMLKELNVTIFVVGLGTDYDVDYARSIASTSEYLFEYPDNNIQDVYSLISTVYKETCPTGAAGTGGDDSDIFSRRIRTITPAIIPETTTAAVTETPWWLNPRYFLTDAPAEAAETTRRTTQIQTASETTWWWNPNYFQTEASVTAEPVETTRHTRPPTTEAQVASETPWWWNPWSFTADMTVVETSTSRPPRIKVTTTATEAPELTTEVPTTRRPLRPTTTEPAPPTEPLTEPRPPTTTAGPPTTRDISEDPTTRPTPRAKSTTEKITEPAPAVTMEQPSTPPVLPPVTNNMLPQTPFIPSASTTTASEESATSQQAATTTTQSSSEAPNVVPWDFDLLNWAGGAGNGTWMGMPAFSSADILSSFLPADQDFFNLFSSNVTGQKQQMDTFFSKNMFPDFFSSNQSRQRQANSPMSQFFDPNTFFSHENLIWKGNQSKQPMPDFNSFFDLYLLQYFLSSQNAEAQKATPSKSAGSMLQQLPGLADPSAIPSEYRHMFPDIFASKNQSEQIPERIGFLGSHHQLPNTADPNAIFGRYQNMLPFNWNNRSQFISNLRNSTMQQKPVPFFNRDILHSYSSTSQTDKPQPAQLPGFADTHSIFSQYSSMFPSSNQSQSIPDSHMLNMYFSFLGNMMSHWQPQVPSPAPSNQTQAPKQQEMPFVLPQHFFPKNDTWSPMSLNPYFNMSKLQDILALSQSQLPLFAMPQPVKKDFWQPQLPGVADPAAIPIQYQSMFPGFSMQNQSHQIPFLKPDIFTPNKNQTLQSQLPGFADPNAILSQFPFMASAFPSSEKQAQQHVMQQPKIPALLDPQSIMAPYQYLFRGLVPSTDQIQPPSAPVMPSFDSDAFMRGIFPFKNQTHQPFQPQLPGFQDPAAVLGQYRLLHNSPSPNSQTESQERAQSPMPFFNSEMLQKFFAHKNVPQQFFSPNVAVKNQSGPVPQLPGFADVRGVLSHGLPANQNELLVHFPFSNRVADFGHALLNVPPHPMHPQQKPKPDFPPSWPFFIRPAETPQQPFFFGSQPLPTVHPPTTIIAPTAQQGQTSSDKPQSTKCRDFPCYFRGYGFNNNNNFQLM